MSDALIRDVSDTASWIAHYRALESERPDALFRDPLARVLAGLHGEHISRAMASRSRYTAWSVVIRTVIIDDFITKLVHDGIDTVVNCGAGLDTRPYRMNLPEHLKWIEVDYPHLMALKEERLREEKPRCDLRRVSMDLSDVEKRRQFFQGVADIAQNALILTEGVIPYLTNDQVAAFAKDLRAQRKFKYWIVDYFSPEVMKFIVKMRRRQLKNAPIVFQPPGWQAFFEENGWKVKEQRFLPEESLRLGRKPPIPWYTRLLMPIVPKEKKEGFKKMMAYVLLEPR